MPEGDVLFRTAVTLQTWLAGREVTDATTAAKPVVGHTVEKVEADGKHLLVRFDSGHVLHTHLRMSGSWHAYSAGERWQRPPSQARVSVTCGERVAVCFNSPVVELTESLGPNGPLIGEIRPFTGRPRRWVYRRAGQPCHRCGATMQSRGQGEQSPRAGLG